MAAHGNVPKINLFVLPHKFLRVMFLETIQLVGRTDVTDASEVKQSADSVEQLLSTLHHHSQTEDKYIIAKVAERVPAAIGSWEKEHTEHVSSINRIRESAKLLAKESDVDKKSKIAFELYQDLTRFAAHDFEHMLEEETQRMELIHAHYSPIEVLNMELEAVKNLPPELLFAALPVMMRSNTPQELVGPLRGMKAGMPPHVWQAVVTCCKANAKPEFWNKVEKSLA